MANRTDAVLERRRERGFEPANRLWGAPGFGTVAEEPAFGGQNISPGAMVEGWLAGKYLPVELMDEAVLVFDGVYFGLR